MKAQIILVTKDFGEIAGSVLEYPEDKIQDISSILGKATIGELDNIMINTKKDGIPGQVFIPKAILLTSIIFLKLEE